MFYNPLLVENLVEKVEEFDQGEHSIYNWMPESKWGNNPACGYVLHCWQQAAQLNNRKPWWKRLGF